MSLELRATNMRWSANDRSRLAERACKRMCGRGSLAAAAGVVFAVVSTALPAFAAALPNRRQAGVGRGGSGVCRWEL